MEPVCLSVERGNRVGGWSLSVEEAGGVYEGRGGRHDEGPARYYGAPEDLGTSWVSVLLGWLAAVGASVIFIGLVSGIVGGILGVGGTAGSAGTVFAVGVLIALFVAFFIGGYAAGRMASRAGTKHGLLVALVALIVSLFLALVGGAVGYTFADSLSGVVIPGVPNIFPEGLGTYLTLSSVLALILPFVAGALGGAQGARTGARRTTTGSYYPPER